VAVLTHVPDMDAFTSAMQDEGVPAAMAHDGVLPETLVILVEQWNAEAIGEDVVPRRRLPNPPSIEAKTRESGLRRESVDLFAWVARRDGSGAAREGDGEACWTRD
jgi:hypothetical protein